MRTMYALRFLPFLAALLASSPAFAQNFVASLDGGQQNPPIVSAATGDCTASLDSAQTALTIDCTHDVSTVSTVTAGHIHIGAAGVNGNVVFGFSDATSPISATWTPVSNAVECGGSCLPALLAGDLYVNIHSPTFPGGEVRGQLEEVTPPIVTVPTLGATGLATLLSLLALAGLLLLHSRR